MRPLDEHIKNYLDRYVKDIGNQASALEALDNRRSTLLVILDTRGAWLK